MLDATAVTTGRARRPARGLPARERPVGGLGRLGPNWFAAVMGTGIVANAALLTPQRVPGQRGLALAVWALAVALLAGLVVVTVAQWRRDPAAARAHVDDPAMIPFAGAPPMALLTVGAGTLLVGRDVLGEPTAVAVAALLWTLGTGLGLAVAAVVPVRLLTRHAVTARDAVGGWLMPVVPPMVSAATGAALVGHLPAGPARVALLLACYVLFGLALLASAVVIALLGTRLARHGIGPASQVPGLWIVLGPLGQSVTAAGLLAAAAPTAVGPAAARALATFGLHYGAAGLALALAWLATVVTITARTARRGLPFALTWWSFTFPVGTCATGAGVLARETGLAALGWLASALLVGLVVAWAVVGTRTAAGALRGDLPAPTPTPTR